MDVLLVARLIASCLRRRRFMASVRSRHESAFRARAGSP
jgi:hypothetical protein